MSGLADSKSFMAVARIECKEWLEGMSQAVLTKTLLLGVSLSFVSYKGS